MLDSEATCPIPSISYDVLLNGDTDSKAQAVCEMNNALKTYGVCRVRHGIPQATIDSCFEKSKLFFQRPLKEKIVEYGNSGAMMHSRFIPFASEKVCGQIHMDEAMELGNCVYSQSGNWPGPAKGLLDASEPLHRECNRIHRGLLDCLSPSICLPQSLPDLHSNNNSYFAPYYYRFNGIGDTNTLRVPPHIDPTTLLFCLPDPLGGLEVADISKMDKISSEFVGKSARFIPIPYQPGELILLAGHLLRRLTGGEFKHSVHRVKRPLGSSGFHLNYWTVPNMDTSLRGAKEDVAGYLSRVFPASVRKPVA
ncbi:hypothetical protein FQN49_002212 [Arthroderma sp. PD_2]|nr:hypothetical protein FQN49_002212 [Arthroderma sp. PD_2]